MKISIIVCVSKSRHFLKDCLSSLAEEINGQEKKEIQIILVEDHIEQFIKEVEPLKEVIQTMKTRLPIEEIRLSHKTGVAAARNCGLKKAKGEYVLFLDDDDYLERGAVSVYLSAIKGKQQVISFQTKKVRVGRNTYFGLREAEVNSLAEQVTVCSSKENAAYVLIKEKEQLKNVSALNILFRRSFLEANYIAFEEDSTFYCDLTFVVQVIAKLSTFRQICNCTYCKRVHNDPIQDPSLSQIQSKDRFDQYIMAYKTAIRLAKGQLQQQYLEQLFVEYVLTTFAPHLRKDQGSEQWKYRFFCVQEQLLQASENVEKTVHGYKRKVLAAIRNGKPNKAVRIMTRHIACNKIIAAVHKRSVLCKELYLHLFYRFKVRESYVVFESFLGRSYSDSPKYVFEYLEQEYPKKYKCIWVFRDTKKKLPFKAIKVKRFSIRYAYYLAVSKYFVYNMRQPVFMHVKEDQVFCQTWHGIPMKRIMFDQEEVTGPDKNYKKTAYKQSREWNYLVSPNAYCTAIFKRCFLFENKILETGYPRNDILHINKVEKVKKTKALLRIPENKKVILYAPTFRDNAYYQLGEYKYKNPFDFKKLKGILGNDFVLLIRTHYLIADSMDLRGVEDFVIDASKYEDISELYLISDVMISDYSSVAFDFANLKRPMIFYMYDLEQYREQLRGFYIDIEKELPGPIVTTEDQVIQAVRELDRISQQYKQKYQAFYDKYCSLEDGQSTRRLVRELFQ
ncbi:MAG: bifunctional glycosyltransferase family 2 protein/CDP-glycerol:glycerophosphate glycerophosphotransferase [bacterium]|nr:bifunctional glycosyltransferase family 2 protein/CDP-glycerol:glycerophosphate glycerophosphotransferase [bacterium]